MSQKVILDQSVKRITRAAMPIFGTFFFLSDVTIQTNKDANFTTVENIYINTQICSGAPEFDPDFCGFHGDQSSVFCVKFFRSLFFIFYIVLSVRRFLASDYLFVPPTLRRRGL